MLRVQQGLNDRFLQDGSGSLRTVPLLGTGINIPMAIPGLQPTLTLRTEMHQHQHLHHHQHVVPALPYAPLPTVPPPVHPIQVFRFEHLGVSIFKIYSQNKMYK